MPKLCQCHEVRMKDVLKMREEDEDITTFEDIERVLATECLCTKKQFKQPCFYCSYEAVADTADYCTTLMVAHNRSCAFKNRAEERQSQSPCEPLPDRAELSQEKEEENCVHDWQEIGFVKSHGNGDFTQFKLPIRGCSLCKTVKYQRYDQ